MAKTSVLDILANCSVSSVLLIGIILHYYLFDFWWPWLWLNFTRSSESKTSWVHFLAHFLADQNKIWCVVEVIYIEHTNATTNWQLSSVKERTNILLILSTTIKLTLAYIWTFMTPFLSNFVWWYILHNSTFWFGCEWPWPLFKATGALIISLSFNWFLWYAVKVFLVLWTL